MLERYFLKPQTVDRIRGNWLGSAIKRYVKWLEQEGCHRPVRSTRSILGGILPSRRSALGRRLAEMARFPLILMCPSARASPIIPGAAEPVPHNGEGNKSRTTCAVA